MKVYDRLKMELANQEYFNEEQYNQFLLENDLVPTAEYNRLEMQKQLYFTCIDILEAVCNDIDLMTGISTEFSNIGQAYQFMEARIVNLKDKIASIPDPEEEYSQFSLMYTRSGKASKATGTVVTEEVESISSSKLEAMIRKEFY